MAKVLFVLTVPAETEDKDVVKSVDRNGEQESKNKIVTSGESLELTADNTSEKRLNASSGWNFDDTLKQADDSEQDQGKKHNTDADGVIDLKKVNRKKSLEEQKADGLKLSESAKNITDIQNNAPEEKDAVDSAGSNNNRKNSLDLLTDEEKSNLIQFLTPELTLLEQVKDVLEYSNVSGVNWNSTDDEMHIGMFITDDGERCEEILQRLTLLKISISVFPASISIASLTKKDEAEQVKQRLEKEDKLAQKVSEFKKSIKSRLVVAQVVDSVKSDALFTFDFLMLVMLASMVAVMGLLEASSVALVASMLVSPLMGPIIAGVFGTVIQNMDLLKVGFRSEIKGLCLCIIMGFVSGFIPAILETVGAKWRATNSWPTIEMSTRGSLRSLLVGVLIAIPSGAGVALSILGGKVGSLVGVAISASLLPPAVNAGLLWANALVVTFRPPLINYSSIANSSDNGTTVSQPEYKGHLKCPAFKDNEFVPEYFCDMARESVVLGVVSLLLTILNIVCIIIMGIVVLKIKEVAPIHSGPAAENQFFGEDIKIARESNTTNKGQTSAILGKKFLQEYRKVKNELGVEIDSNQDEEELHQIVEEVEESQSVKEIADLMPHKPKRWSVYLHDDSQDEEKAYRTIQIGSLPYNGFASEDSVQMRRRHVSHGDKRPVSETSDSHINTYFTIHRLPSPRSTTNRFHMPKSMFVSPKIGRFKVDKVAEKSSEKGAKSARSPVPKIKIDPSENVPLVSYIKEI
ncbi:unnamed protein product [Lymnaea stagnalis]|uniref:Uncharacterized protein n=1 Tax=Lymnaea stagnalis TaxID=6523 RepID=A0AAV2IDT9_LYMST